MRCVRGIHLICAYAVFKAFGGLQSFHGQVLTVKCNEDNSHVKLAVESARQDSALGLCPMPPVRADQGQTGGAVFIHATVVHMSDWLCADADGIVISGDILLVSSVVFQFHYLKIENAALPHFFSIWKIRNHIAKLVSQVIDFKQIKIRLV